MRTRSQTTRRTYTRRRTGRLLMPVFVAMLLVVLAATLCLSGCTTEEENRRPANTELRLSTAIAAHTRANWQSEQIIPERTVYAWVDASEPFKAATPYLQAWQLTAEANGKLEGGIKYYPEASDKVSIYAMHGSFDPAITDRMEFPATTPTATTTLTHTVAANQTLEAAYASSDLLYATALNRDCTTNAIPLTFYHLLAKIEVALTAGTGVTDAELAGITVRILGTRRVATFTPSKTVDMTNKDARAKMIAPPGSTPEAITIAGTKSADFNTPDYNQAVIVPQYLPVNTDFIEVSNIMIDGTPTTLRYQLNKDTRFESGMKYRYHVTVTNVELKVAPAQIEGWNENNKIEAGLLADQTLHLSKTTASVSEITTERIYFRSNQPTVTIETKGYKGTSGTNPADEFNVDAVFDNPAANLTYDASKGEGHIDLRTKRGTTATGAHRIFLNAGGLRRQITATPKPAPAPWGTNPWVGTFHRHNEKGERIIYAGYALSWSARVEYPAGTPRGRFVVLSTAPSLDTNLKTDSPGNPEDYEVAGNAEAVSGTGNIFFRVGMTTKLASATTPPPATPRLYSHSPAVTNLPSTFARAKRQTTCIARIPNTRRPSSSRPTTSPPPIHNGRHAREATT